MDLDFNIPEHQPVSGVELLNAETRLEYNKVLMTWMEAEKVCVLRGGQTSLYQWHRLQSLFGEQISFTWLGGTDEKGDGEWAWTDGNRGALAV